MDLEVLLPQLLPRAIAWAKEVAADAATRGTALTAPEIADARVVGVQHPKKIRVLMIERPPLPSDPQLQAALTKTNLLGPTMAGLTLGYSILVCRGHLSRRLLSHECRHVAQYEQSGSLDAFLTEYLGSFVRVGYWNCPFEEDARARELPDR